MLQSVLVSIVLLSLFFSDHPPSSEFRRWLRVSLLPVKTNRPCLRKIQQAGQATIATGAHHGLYHDSTVIITVIRSPVFDAFRLP